MKPEWKDAPKWANWLAMDYDGEWYWFEEKPDYERDGVWRTQGGKHKAANVAPLKPVIEARPS